MLSGLQPFLPSPHNDRSCWRARWEMTCCLGVWHCASRQPPGSDSTIRFTKRWHRSSITFPAGTYVQRNRKLTPQSFAKALNSLLQKAMSLSVRSLCGGLRSKNTISSWQITLAESCLANYLQIEKCDGPQSVSIRKWWALLCMMSIPNLCQLSSTSSVPFFQWTGAGSVYWYSSHVLMAILTAALGVAGQVLLTK